MKAPPANLSKETVALRRAAIAFSRGIQDPATDSHDGAGAKRNRALLRAAIAYANQVIREQGHPILDALKDAREFMSADDYNTLDGWANAADNALAVIYKYDPDWTVP